MRNVLSCLKDNFFNVEWKEGIKEYVNVEEREERVVCVYVCVCVCVCVC